MGIVLTGDAVQLFRAKVILQGILLEMKGMRRHGRSCYSIAKEAYGLTGNRAKVAASLAAMIESDSATPQTKGD